MTRSLASLLLMPRLVRRASEIWLPTVKTGFRALIGSWKTMAIFLPRSSRMSASDLSSTLSPSNRMRPSKISPGGMGMRRMTARAVTVLPEPDSPTSPKVSLRFTVKETRSTAVSLPRLR